MKKSKLLTSLAVATASIVPVSFATGCSCSKANWDPLTQEFKKQVIEEFTTIVKTPHATGHTRQMATYLKEYFSPYMVADSWYEDEYRHGTTESEREESSGNICFDVKASDGCETWPGVTLQGHYDMVAAGTTEDTTKGVDAVVDGNIMHSRHYESTLGADDGIGLAIIGTIVKNQNKFNHGPLHILLTSDEEADTSGAYMIPNDEYDMVKYDNVINIDAEADKKITVSCASTYSTKYNLSFESDDFEEITEKIYPYTIKISGLLGGHSANNINEGRLNAIKIAGDLLPKLNYGYKLKIIDIKSSKESNKISNELEMTFCCETLMINDIIQQIINPLISNYKVTNPIETELKIDISETTIEPGSGIITRMLNPKGSWKLYTLLRDLPFGPYEWIDKDLKEVATSNNIGALSFNANDFSQRMTIKSFSRSCYQDHDKIINDYIEILAQNIFDETNVEIEDPEASPTWRYQEKNSLFDVFNQGYKEIGITPDKRNAHSWLECAYFCQKEAHKNANMIAVGPYIKDAHSVKETLYLDTLDPLISSLLYTLQNIKNI